MYLGYYVNWVGDKFLGLIQIFFDVIESNVLSVFVVYKLSYEDWYIKFLCNYSVWQDFVDQDILVMDCFLCFYILQLDGVFVEVDYLFI